jgi:hypothetical protein
MSGFGAKASSDSQMEICSARANFEGLCKSHWRLARKQSQR